MAWEHDYFRLFISHTSAFHEFASAIAKILHDRYGIDGFVAHADIEPSADWQNEIEASLKSMDALLALLTPGFSQSYWCNQEVGWALGRPCLAVSVWAGEDPRGFVGRFQGVPGGDGNVLRIADTVFDVLAKHPTTRVRIGIVTSLRLRHANSWESIRYYIGPQIERLTQMTPEILDNLEAAFHESHHVQESYYLSDVRALLAKNGRQLG